MLPEAKAGVKRAINIICYSGGEGSRQFSYQIPSERENVFCYTVVEDLAESGEGLGSRTGLYVLYTPCYDRISRPSLFPSGARVALFATGRGTGIGCALGPVVKTGSNSVHWRNHEDIDLNAGTILDRKESTQEVGRRIFEETIV